MDDLDEALFVVNFLFHRMPLELESVKSFFSDYEVVVETSITRKRFLYQDTSVRLLQRILSLVFFFSSSDDNMIIVNTTHNIKTKTRFEKTEPLFFDLMFLFSILGCFKTP